LDSDLAGQRSLPVGKIHLTATGAGLTPGSIEIAIVSDLKNP
jgi:hypothetical protein